MESKAFEEEIDLVWLFYALFKKLWLIIAVAVVCACGMAGYTYLKVQPTYT
jgi:LPS O-antigen subunit length determinant protein (WzzB/FepE family)